MSIFKPQDGYVTLCMIVMIVLCCVLSEARLPRDLSAASRLTCVILLPSLFPLPSFPPLLLG